MRALFAIAVLLGAIAASCSKDTTGQCPSELFKQGDRCEGYVRRTCPFLGSKCGRTMCVCENEPGGFRWQCQVAYCSCSCPCGTVVTASCDVLDCSEPQDSCPASAADRCAAVCVDAQIPDAGDGGPDGLDARSGDGADSRSDSRGDSSGADAPRDAPRDAPSDAPIDAPSG